MKANRFTAWILTGLATIAGGAAAGDHPMTGKCVKVVDGDTLVVVCEKFRRTVEIDGIDAPELRQPWGKETRNFVRSMVGGERVEIQVVEGDADTVRARVFVNGADLSEMLVGRGLAWVAQDSADAALLTLGSKARELPCGLWLDPHPQAPWEFRNS